MKREFYLFLSFIGIFTSFYAQVTDTTSFITTWKTDNAGISNSTSITIPVHQFGNYNYDVDWNNDGVFDELNVTGSVTHDFLAAGIYTIRIRGVFPHIYFNNSGDKEKLLAINQWGNIQWGSMNHAFWGCINLEELATDAPDLSQVTNINRMFMDAQSFNQDISNWQVGNTITQMISTFQNAQIFNQDISHWDVSNVTNMNAAFLDAKAFNKPLDSWDVSKVTNMIAMFSGASSFDQPLNSWNVGNVLYMNFLFSGASSFNGDISAWDVSSVLAMNTMFGNAFNFNQDISGWDTSNVSNFGTMFSNAQQFNQPIGSWNVGSATNMGGMLQLASSFDQDLGAWDVSNKNLGGLLFGVSLSTHNYDSLLASWANQNLLSNIYFPVGNSKYCDSSSRQFIVDQYGWNILDGGEDNECSEPFMTTWRTDNPGTSNNSSITIPTLGSGYNYNIDWEGDGVYDDFGVTGNITHDYGVAGTYTVVIEGDFPRIYFNNSGDKNKLLTIEQWGNNPWTSMERAFWGCENLILNASDAPNLSLVTNMSLMFFNAKSLNQDINHWDVSSVTNMHRLFAGTAVFNQDLSNWQVNNVTNMRFMFSNSGFDSPIGNWNVGNVSDMGYLFSNSPFNQDLSAWDVSSVLDMESMFQSTPFNQDISNWNVSSVTDFSLMFGFTPFNQDIGNWDIGNAINLESMFFATPFNQNIGLWDTSSVTDMDQMFRLTPFDQDLSNWDVSNVSSMISMFFGVTLSTTNYDAILNSWSSQNLQPNVTFGAGNSKYCEGVNERQSIIDNYGWNITDGGPENDVIFSAEILPEIVSDCAIFYLEPPTASDCQGNSIIAVADFNYPITSTSDIRWVYSNQNGVETQQLQSIVINDVTPPVIQCKDIEILLDETGFVQLTALDVVLSAEDECGVGSYHLDKYYFDENDIGDNEVILSVYDTSRNLSQCTAIVTIYQDEVAIESIDLPIDPVLIGDTVYGTANYSGQIVEAIWDWGDQTSDAGIFEDGVVTGNHTYTTPGVYSVTLSVKDTRDEFIIETFNYVVIYDPEGGFVTGGGWIDSPEGAYRADLTLTGKATFGFVAKYKKGQSVPTGNTEFQFNVANFNFKSVSYDWLIVAGTKAMFKGLGTINGSGSFKFILSAKDEDKLNGEDTFRIKISDFNDHIIYDNQIALEENEYPDYVIGGGSIIVHDGKKNSNNSKLRPQDGVLHLLSYPNPSKDYYEIRLNTADESPIKLFVYDINGKLVHNNGLIPNVKYQFGANLQSGIYIAKVVQSNKIATARLVKF